MGLFEIVIVHGSTNCNVSDLQNIKVTNNLGREGRGRMESGKDKEKD